MLAVLAFRGELLHVYHRLFVSNPLSSIFKSRGAVVVRSPSTLMKQLLLRVSRGPAVGDSRGQRDGGRRGRAHQPAHLLRQPVRQTVLGGQLSLPVPDDSRGAGQRRVAGVRAARR